MMIGFRLESLSYISEIYLEKLVYAYNVVGVPRGNRNILDREITAQYSPQWSDPNRNVQICSNTYWLDWGEGDGWNKNLRPF